MPAACWHNQPLTCPYGRNGLRAGGRNGSRTGGFRTIDLGSLGVNSGELVVISVADNNVVVVPLDSLLSVGLNGSSVRIAVRTSVCAVAVWVATAADPATAATAAQLCHRFSNRVMRATSLGLSHPP